MRAVRFAIRATEDNFLYQKAVFEYLRVQPLHTFRHGIAYVGIALMPVQPHYLYLFAV